MGQFSVGGNSATAFRAMSRQWRDDLVRFRCGLDAQRLQALRPEGGPWACEDVQVVVETVSPETLEPARAARLLAMPTRLVLTAAQVDEAIDAGRDAALRTPALSAYVAVRRAARHELPAQLCKPAGSRPFGGSPAGAAADSRYGAEAGDLQHCWCSAQ